MGAALVSAVWHLGMWAAMPTSRPPDSYFANAACRAEMSGFHVPGRLPVHDMLEQACRGRACRAGNGVTLIIIYRRWWWMPQRLPPNRFYTSISVGPRSRLEHGILPDELSSL